MSKTASLATVSQAVEPRASRGRFMPGSAAHFGRLGGTRRSAAKTRAARRNAKKKRKRNALFSSRSEEWSTPAHLFRELDAEFGPFDLDPCATPENAKAGPFYTKKDDGLARPWASHRVFLNPPYGAAIGRWMHKAAEEARAGALVVALIPARTDTAWWHETVAPAAVVRFLCGRLRFGDAEASAPFPSAIVVFTPGRGK